MVKTKRLGGLTNADPWAEEFSKNNVDERVEESDPDMGKVNPGQKEFIYEF